MSFPKKLNQSIEGRLIGALQGSYPIYIPNLLESNYFGEGFSVNLGETRVSAYTPLNRTITYQQPEASILIKKKAFSTFKHTNDLQWMDRTERMLLRATKALFAYKCAQIRAYEALTKFDKFFNAEKQLHLSYFASLLQSAKFLKTDSSTFTSSAEALQLLSSALAASFDGEEYDGYRDDILQLIKRASYQEEQIYTTWIVDFDNLDNYGTGPGTGVIELGGFTSFSTSCSLDSNPSGATVTMVDPNRLSIITEDEIEIAIEEAINGTIGILSDLATGGIDVTQFDAKSVVSSIFTAVGGPLPTGIDVDTIRDRLRVFYMGKPIVNSGDGIHIFVRSNTGKNFQTDESFTDTSFYEIDDSILEAERTLFTNKKIDFDTYKQLRVFQTNSLSMQQVFAGLVKNPSCNYSSGQFQMTLNCEDNMSWLLWSRFMSDPALGDPQGILEDPLTPYDIPVDASGTPLTGNGPQLLEENKELLNSGLLSYDSGIFNGQVANENNFIQGQYNGGGSLAGAKIVQHPNGFVYRWKTGILTATLDVAVSDPLSEKSVTQKVFNQTYGVTVAQEVLQNLDIANILSVLIVGQPYNIETFMEQAYQAHNLSKASSTSSLSSTDPLTSVIDVIRRQNLRFGDFKPYRMITQSHSTLEQSATSSAMRIEANESLLRLRARKIELQGLINKLEQDKKGNAIYIRTLRAEMDSVQAGVQAQLSKVNQSESISSTDILTENFNLFGQNRSLPLTGNFSADHDLTRAMTLVGAKRRIEDVRLNKDSNLFIVSDQYDQNTDIRPNLLKIRDANINIFKGNFMSVHQKCVEAASFVNFEFFCNPQGHLEFRPPQWNQTPLSVLKRMFEISKDETKTIIPDFLRQMFEDRSASLRREIHSYNIGIVILALLLGKYPDSSIIPNFRDPALITKWRNGTEFIGKAYMRFFGVNPGGITEQESSLLSSQGELFSIGDIVNTGTQMIGEGFALSYSLGEEGDIINADTSTILGIFDPVFQEEKNLVSNLLTSSAQGGASSNEFATADNVNNVRKEFRRLSGIDPAAAIIGNTDEFVEANFVFYQNLDDGQRVGLIEKYLKNLENIISSRDRLVTVLLRNKEKEDKLDEIEDILSGEFTSTSGGSDNSDIERTTRFGDFVQNVENGLDSVESTLSKVYNGVKSIDDIFSGEAGQGSLFDHLVEDDSRNLDGPGSGKRFIIEDSDIIDLTLTETPPETVNVNVVGDAPLDIGSSLQSSFEEKYFWAGATDFDLWRQYGFITQGTTSLPFANDADLQCKPMAIMELQLQRIKIHRGSVTLRGNEYYAPGDTVFLRMTGLLYYVRSVTHSFSWGGDFQTSLDLENGHPPGQYLPSPLDIIGQQLSKDYLKDGQSIVYRNQKGDDAYRALQPDSNLIFPNIDIDPATNLNMLLDYHQNQVRYTNMMIDLNSIAVGNRIVLIRGFIRGENDRADVKKRLAVMRYLLENPSMMSQTNTGSTYFGGGGGDDVFDFVSEKVSSVGLNIGNSKSISTLLLPNGLVAQPIPSEMIVEQIVTLNGKSTTSEILCLNAQLLSGEESEAAMRESINVTDIDPDEYAAVFPKGGPKQSSWLDIRDDLTLVSHIIEVGILDLQRELS